MGRAPARSASVGSRAAWRPLQDAGSARRRRPGQSGVFGHQRAAIDRGQIRLGARSGHQDDIRSAIPGRARRCRGAGFGENLQAHHQGSIRGRGSPGQPAATRSQCGIRRAERDLPHAHCRRGRFHGGAPRHGGSAAGGAGRTADAAGPARRAGGHVALGYPGDARPSRGAAGARCRRPVAGDRSGARSAGGRAQAIGRRRCRANAGAPRADSDHAGSLHERCGRGQGSGACRHAA